MSILSFDATPPELAYGDASFFVGVFIEEDKYHGECTKFARKLKAAESLVALSPFGLDEIWFAMLKIFATKDLGERGWQRELKNNPNLVRRYASRIEQIHKELLALPYVVVIEVSSEYILEGLKTMKTYGLFPRDAIHTSITKLPGIANIITTNRDYARASTEINVYTCNQNALRQGTTG